MKVVNWIHHMMKETKSWKKENDNHSVTTSGGNCDVTAFLRQKQKLSWTTHSQLASHVDRLHTQGMEIVGNGRSTRADLGHTSTHNNT